MRLALLCQIAATLAENVGPTATVSLGRDGRSSGHPSATSPGTDPAAHEDDPSNQAGRCAPASSEAC
jgi:hypothetical protein